MFIGRNYYTLDHKQVIIIIKLTASFSPGSSYSLSIYGKASTEVSPNPPLPSYLLSVAVRHHALDHTHTLMGVCNHTYPLMGGVATSTHLWAG